MLAIHPAPIRSASCAARLPGSPSARFGRACAIACGWALAAALCLHAGPVRAEPGLPAPAAPSPAAEVRHVELEGVPFEDTALVGGQRLVLNGVSIHKRAFFKTEVVGLYLPQKMNSPEAIMRMPGPKRLRLVLLRDISGSQVSRFFINDFKRWASEDEFKQLITELGQVGALYAGIKQLRRGDEVLIDWIPGKGLVSTINGKSAGEPIASELFFQITCLRPGVGPDAPAEARRAYAGQTPLPTVPGPYPGPGMTVADAQR